MKGIDWISFGEALRRFGPPKLPARKSELPVVVMRNDYPELSRLMFKNQPPSEFNLPDKRFK